MRYLIQHKLEKYLHRPKEFSPLMNWKHSMYVPCTLSMTCWRDILFAFFYPIQKALVRNHWQENPTVTISIISHHFLQLKLALLSFLLRNIWRPTKQKTLHWNLMWQPFSYSSIQLRKKQMASTPFMELMEWLIASQMVINPSHLRPSCFHPQRSHHLCLPNQSCEYVFVCLLLGVFPINLMSVESKFLPRAI